MYALLELNGYRKKISPFDRSARACTSYRYHNHGVGRLLYCVLWTDNSSPECHLQWGDMGRNAHTQIVHLGYLYRTLMCNPMRTSALHPDSVAMRRLFHPINVLPATRPSQAQRTHSSHTQRNPNAEGSQRKKGSERPCPVTAASLVKSK